MTIARRIPRLDLVWLTVLLIVVTTAVPVGLRPPVTRWLPTGFGEEDLIRNFLLFLPPGLFMSAGSIGSATLAGAALSIGVEVVQVFSPGRYASFGDVLANTAGAACGWALARFLSVQVSGVPVRRCWGVIGLGMIALFPLLYPPVFVWIRVRYGNAHPLFTLGASTESASLAFFVMLTLLAIAGTDRWWLKIVLGVLTVGVAVGMVGAVTFFGSTVAERAAGAAIGAGLALSVLRTPSRRDGSGRRAVAPAA
jgi:hypothetical protein